MVSDGKSAGKGAKGVKGNPPKFIIIRRPLPPEGKEVKQARREQALDGQRERCRLARLEAERQAAEAELAFVASRKIVQSHHRKNESARSERERFHQEYVDMNNRQPSHSLVLPDRVSRIEKVARLRDGEQMNIETDAKREKYLQHYETTEACEEDEQQNDALELKEVQAKADFICNTADTELPPMKILVRPQLRSKVNSFDMRKLIVENERLKLDEVRRNMKPADRSRLMEKSFEYWLTTDVSIYADLTEFYACVEFSKNRIQQELWKDHKQRYVDFASCVDDSEKFLINAKYKRMKDQAVQYQEEFVDGLLELLKRDGCLSQGDKIESFEPTYVYKTVADVANALVTSGLAVTVYNPSTKCMQSKVLQVDKTHCVLKFEEVGPVDRDSPVTSFMLSDLRRIINTSDVGSTLQTVEGPVVCSAMSVFRFAFKTVYVQFRSADASNVCTATQKLCHRALHDLLGVNLDASIGAEKIN